MNLFEVQLVVLLVLLVGTFICGILPLICFRYNKGFQSDHLDFRSLIAYFVIYFGGGVLMSTSLLLMLPHGREGFVDSHPHEEHENPTFQRMSNASETEAAVEIHEHSFAMPEFIFLCGFMGTYLIEVFVHFVVDLRKTNISSSTEPKFCSCAKRNMECSKIYKDLRSERSNDEPAAVDKRKRSSTWAGNTTPAQIRTLDKAAECPPDLLMRSSIISQPYPNYGAVATDGDGLQTLVEDCITIVKRSIVIDNQSAIPSGIPEIVIETQSVATHGLLSVCSLLTVVVISCHAILEGFIVGSQLLTISDTWTLFLKVAIHKFLLSFVVSLEALADGSGPLLVAGSIALFACMSPLGMTMTMFLTDTDWQVSDLVVGTVDCIAAGTLLYATFFQVWPKKSQDNMYCRLRCFALASGAALMAALQYACAVL